MGQMTIEELAGQTQTSPRMIRYYIAEGMLPSPGARGRAASYGEEHLARLQLVRALLARRLPLAEIKQALAGLSLDEIRALLNEAQEQKNTLEQAAQAPSPRRYISELLRQTQDQREARQSQQNVPAMPLRQPQQYAGSLPSSTASPNVSPPASLTPGQPEQTWQRIELTPDIELHVRAAAAERLRPLIDALVALAKKASWRLK
ncbi:MAG: MerR family transcriptional regulator [Ktedonobacterales bacterium]